MYAPTSNTASYDKHEKINSWVSFCFPYEHPLLSITLHVNYILTFFSKNPDFEFSISTSSHGQRNNSTACLLLWLELDGYDFHVMRWVNTSVWDITKMQRRLIIKQHTHKKKVCQLLIILVRKSFSVIHCNFDFTVAKQTCLLLDANIEPKKSVECEYFKPLEDSKFGLKTREV